MYVHVHLANNPNVCLTSHLTPQEYFFVPYAFTDVNDEREIHNGDEVSFYMAKNKRSGALRARMVRLVQSAKVETIQVSTNVALLATPRESVDGFCCV